MKRITISIIILVVLYLLMLYGTATQGTMTILQTTVNCVILFGSYIIIPLLYILITKSKDKNSVKKVSIISSLIMSTLWTSTYFWGITYYNSTVFIIYIVSYIVFGIALYFVNFNMFYIEENKKQQEDAKNENGDNFDENKYENLKKLKQLLDDNIITQEEFEKEKKKILK